MQKVTWNDIQEAHQNDLKRVYKLSDRDLEKQIRTHMDGANHEERRNFYQKMYGNKR